MKLENILAAFLALSVSVAAQSTSPVVGGVWAGNVSPTSVTVAARINESGARVRLVVSPSESLAAPMFSPVVTTASASGNAVKLTVQGLQPGTDYHYALEVRGVVRTEANARGKFQTFPLGRASFRVAFGSCSDFRSGNQGVFDEIAREKPLLFIHTGDLHYSNTNSVQVEDHRANYDQVLGHASQGAFYRSMAMAYMWDDHDFCGNDTDSTAAGRDAARAAYRERVPHYPTPVSGGAIGQAFTVGRVRFIMTDLRSAAVPASQRETASKSRLGAAQKAWFKQELIAARDGGFPLIVWVCTVPWISPDELGSDTWGGYATERTELANFIRDNRVSNLVLFSGDMHGLAFDDGTHSDYATGGGAPVTVLHAAALTEGGLAKGGPYSGGLVTGSQQYGILEIYDNGGSSVACRFLGTRVGEGRKITQIFSGSAAGSNAQAIVNISTLARVAAGDDALITGFVISGATPRNVLVRAVGPTLSAFGVVDALPRPLLKVFQGDRIVASNEGWAGDSAATAETMLQAFDRAGAFRLLDESSRDAAVFLSLAPGAYTVQVKSGDSVPGSTLLEVYDLP
ncbi:MAG: alkaline phosphatase D family protein [Opitutaceae bacterium]|nr:alkaline phosphatase D family protein [Opitutaceae bacterium]